MTGRKNDKSNYKPRWVKGADFDTERLKPFSFLITRRLEEFLNMSVTELVEHFINAKSVEHFINAKFVEHLVVETRRYAYF